MSLHSLPPFGGALGECHGSGVGIRAVWCFFFFSSVSPRVLLVPLSERGVSVRPQTRREPTFLKSTRALRRAVSSSLGNGCERICGQICVLALCFSPGSDRQTQRQAQARGGGEPQGGSAAGRVAADKVRGAQRSETQSRPRNAGQIGNSLLSLCVSSLLFSTLSLLSCPYPTTHTLITLNLFTGTACLVFCGVFLPMTK